MNCHFFHQNHQPLLTKNIYWKFIHKCLKKELVFHSDMSMHPFTGHYPKTEQESQGWWNKYTHLSFPMNTMNISLLYVVTTHSQIHLSVPQKLYWSFYHWLPWYMMLYSHASTTEKILWNSIFCWVPPSPPPSKTTSAELSHSSH